MKLLTEEEYRLNNKMLLSISITNFILIDNLELDFTDGFTVLTGETGAGKSIILDALLFALGERSSIKYIKNKDSRATVSIAFDVSKMLDLKKHLDELGIDVSEEMIIRRSLFPDGKNKVFVNDVQCSVGQLQFFRDALIEICGQHDSRGLLDSAHHQVILDEFSEVDTTQIRILYKDMHSVRSEISRLKEKVDRSEIEKSFLLNVINDLKDLNLKQNEELQLAEQRKFLQEGSKIKEAINISELLLKDELLPAVYRLQKELSRYQDYFKDQLGMTNNACIELEETLDSIEERAKSFGGDYDNLDQLEDRLFKIRSLARKYNCLSEDFPRLLAEKENELKLLDNSEDSISDLEKKLESIKCKYLNEAKRISVIRNAKALDLREIVLSHFGDLKLDKADFQIEISLISDESNFMPTGFDKIKFLIKTNPGSPFDMLSKIASGGELSRFMLAIKVACAGTKTIPLMIFDEIDTGVSGAVSSAIGKKLAQLSKSAQVIVVTHQPQVAAFSNNHFVVSKKVDDGVTNVYVSILDNKGKEEELARLLSGEEISKESKAAARKLIQAAA